MPTIRGWLARCAAIFRKDHHARDCDDELQSHLALHLADNLRKGMSPGQARREALIRLGGIEQTRRAVRERRSLPALETFLQDAGFGLRTLRKNPGFAAVAILTMALGIGSSATLFSIVYDGIIRRDGPNSSRLGAILAYYPERHFYSYRFSVPEFRDLRSRSDLFEEIGPINGNSETLNTAEYPEHVQVTHAGASQFAISALVPLLGRAFTSEEDRPGGPAVVVISWALWNRDFQRDPQILGKTLQLNHVPHTIIGVLRENDNLWGGDAIVPFQLDLSDNDRQNRRFWITVLLKNGVSTEKAARLLSSTSQRWTVDYASSVPEYAGLRLTYRNGAEWMRAGFMPSVYALAVAVALVLLICCANLATLLLARATTRRREIAIRSSLGAPRSRIVQQLLIESLLPALAGGALGILFSVWGVPLAMSVVPYEYYGWRPDIHLELVAVVVSLSVCVVIGLLSGLAPSLQLASQKVGLSMQETSSRAGGDRRGRVARNFLVVAQMAVAVALLASASLLVRSYAALMAMDLGFQPARVLTLSLTLPQTRYSTTASLAAFWRELLSQLGALPGVDAAALSNGSPMLDRAVDRVRQDFTVVGRPGLDARAMPTADVEAVSPSYFDTLGMRLVRGRFLAPSDKADAPPVAVINDAMARAFWRDAEPVGQSLRLGPENPALPDPADSGVGATLTVVGVVADAKQIRVIDAPVRPEFLVPIEQRPAQTRAMTLLLRSPQDAQQIVATLRTALRSVDPEMPVPDIRSMDKVIADAFGPKRLTTALLVFFAALALALVVVGIYSVLAYAVAQATHAIGVHRALGAQPGDILRMVLRQALGLAAAGAVIGLLVTFAISSVLQTLLYGIRPGDPATLSVCVVLLLLVALFAGVVPARRAMRIDPVEALRYE